MRRSSLLAVLVLVGLSFAAGWFMRGELAPPQPPASAAGADGDPGWLPGQKIKVTVADPITDRYESHVLEVVRVVQLDGDTLRGPDGDTNAPRVEWKLYFPARTYFLVPRAPDATK